MFLRKNFRVALIWTVLLAVFFNVALPTMAAVRAPAEAVAFAEVCGASGIQRMALSSDGHATEATEKHADMLHDGHCLLCIVQIAACRLPDNAAVLPMPARLAYLAQVLPPVAFPRPTPCLIPPSQAPPVFS